MSPGDAIRVKICGLTRPVDAECAIEAGADLLGFVFVADTPRAVNPSGAGWVRDLAGRGTVGVFRNARLGEILEIRKRLALDWVQLHGEEPDSMLEILGGRVLRRVPVDAGVDWSRVAMLAERCLPLVDPGAGDGRPCDWDALGRPPARVPFGLAGGLSPVNVGDAVTTLRPTLVDVSSGVEDAPGVKSHVLVREFVNTARAAAAAACAAD